MAKTLTYTGKDLENDKKFVKDKNGNDREIDIYIPSPELINAVHLAFQVGRPLLIMGEPGCGKTRLAEAVAYELHKENMYDHFFTWNIKSTTKAKDGIYEIDTLQRMYDVNAKELKGIEKYIEYGKLAQAFMKPSDEDKPNILLIDEIDKADIDFPNDLLLELDKKEFYIKELDTSIKATNLLIFITSNEEKELPSAFLRRCLFHFIDFPNTKQLENIVLARYEALKNYEHFKETVAIFEEIRSNLDTNEKRPSTSELIDWFKMIDFCNSIRNNDKLSEQQKLLIQELEKFEESKDQTTIPYSQILIKTAESRTKILGNE